MANPFEKRATEYLRNDEAFLSVVSTAPLHSYFEQKARDGSLYDRLTMVIGTPGSGKTTIATLFQYKTQSTLLQNPGMDSYKELVHAMSNCGVISGNKLVVVGCRLPLETEYREFWELPYPEELRHGLIQSLLQARAVISWVQNIIDTRNVQTDAIKIIPREGAVASLGQIGGENAVDVLEKAREVERAVYRIGAALVSPAIKDIPLDATAAYHPFDVIETFSITGKDSVVQNLKPLVILDDAHTLHPKQLLAVQSWLAKREIRIARWLLMRLDAQTPRATLSEALEHELEGESATRIKPAREITEIWLQKTGDRSNQRQQFRKMAREMADKYISLMDVFRHQGITSLTSILGTMPEPLSEAKYRNLESKVSRVQRAHNISADRRQILEMEVERFCRGSKLPDLGRDVQLGILNILMHRYVKRVPQASLFESQEDLDPNKPISANADVVDGAKIHLLHEYGRPYYYGIDVLCDGSSENAEQFLQLAGRLVSVAETRIIRGDRPLLSTPYQHKVLQKRALEIVQSWSFPEYKLVRTINDEMVRQCVEKALEPNASLGGGPNAFGIPQDEFNKIPESHPDLSQVLKYGIAYNSFSLTQNHKTKGRYWCLLELSGAAIIANGLSLRRGNFLERDVKHMITVLEEGGK
ncbi:MAG: hypothetical protein KZQ99_05050 [Candidatus Thiodiazotropha sp. (ex Dulcina madagascariensis)]|nr:hypothetical protein [Candidatus Thiodiazotropha sp. (ex Dulcina madagascariensis)]